jgi:LacI family transcriptional regulator, galactose operon repressor
MDIREIAKRAKVSTATVSRAINRVPTVDPQLAQRVWKIVDELGYYPNRQARALVSGRTRIFGLIVSEITNPFFPEIVQSFEDMAVENGYELLLTSTVHDPKRMETSVRRMIERRVEGVAVLTFGMEESLLKDLQFRKVPLVFVDVGPEVPGVSTIHINYQQGVRQAVQHVAALRHDRVAFISGPLHLKSALTRKKVFQEAMHEIGKEVPAQMLIEGDHTLEGGMRALTDLMALRERPTAILCSNDMTAIGVMRQAYECGLIVPQDLSVVGFDDIRLAQFTIPPLTTVRMSQSELAKTAFQALLNQVGTNHANSPGRQYELATNLVLRKSTTSAPAKRSMENK